VSQRNYCNKLLLAPVNSDRVSKRPSEPLKSHHHHVAVRQFNALSETKCVRAEEMNVRIAGPPVCVVLKVMVLEVRNRM